MNTCNLSKQKMNQAYKLFFSTLTSKIRLEIINQLRINPKTVSALQKSLKIEQSTLSHNLRRLKNCGFVHVEKEGKYRRYYINKKTIEPLMKKIDTHMNEYCLKIIEGGKK